MQTATDADIEYAKALVDKAFLPVLKRNLDTINDVLAKRGIRAGIDVHWIFDRFKDK